ncbi:MAG TPA: hypothetical protein VGH98_11150 [Gemmatimonadaceae bacterium]|jgi:hypothetical protein
MMREKSPRGWPLVALALCAFAACATTLGQSSGTDTRTAGTSSISPDADWPTSTREHVDLWLHGYAMLTSDTARVPLFRRAYRQRIRAIRSARNAFTQLDANADKLSARFVTNPSLVNGQFVPFYFSSFEQIQQVTDLFIRAEGDPRATNDQTTQQLFGVLNGAFPSAADRDWLRLFVQSLGEENSRFYQAYWTDETGRRAATRRAVDSVWRVYRPKLQRFLNNTQQANGELILSLPLDGEGRTIAYSKLQNSVAVGFPDSAGAAVEAIYVLAHETVNAITATAISDNVTPAELRNGALTRYAANANVRAGAILLQRAAPELVAGYMRYYVRAAGITAPGAELNALFLSTFPIPDAIRDAITRQLDVVLGGI